MRDSATGNETPGGVVVTYWAAARAAAGTPSDDVGLDAPVTLADLLAHLRERHPDARFGRVLGVCSVLLDDQPVSGRDPATVMVRPGSRLDLLPPFAGG